MSLETTAENCV